MISCLPVRTSPIYAKPLLWANRLSFRALLIGDRAELEREIQLGPPPRRDHAGPIEPGAPARSGTWLAQYLAVFYF